MQHQPEAWASDFGDGSRITCKLAHLTFKAIRLQTPHCRYVPNIFL